MGMRESGTGARAFLGREGGCSVAAGVMRDAQDVRRPIVPAHPFPSSPARVALDSASEEMSSAR